MKNPLQNRHILRLIVGPALFITLSVLLIGCMVVPITEPGTTGGWANRVAALETRVTTLEAHLPLTATPVVLPPSQPLTQSSRGLAITAKDAKGHEALILLPAQEITTLRRYNQPALTNLASVLTGTLRLELALIHTTTIGNNSWQLYHTASPVELNHATQIKEFAQQPAPTTDNILSTFYTFGAPYNISTTTPITSAQGVSLPTDFAGWMEHLRPLIGAEPDDPFRADRDHEPARLLFTHSVNGQTSRFLVIFGVTPQGTVIVGPDSWEWARNYCASCGNSCPLWCRWIP